MILTITKTDEIIDIIGAISCTVSLARSALGSEGAMMASHFG
jgi:hypothetical protein